jgi:hypothetical protein
MVIESGFGGTTENSFTIGDGTDGYKYLYANIIGDYDPFLRYNHNSNSWEFSNDGYNIDEISGDVEHNLLLNIQGGITDEYYHLDLDEYTWLTDAYNDGYWSELYGGTGQISYTSGDLLYADGTDSLTKLGIGTADQILKVSGGIPSWQDLTGTLVEEPDRNVAGGTGAMPGVTGDDNTALGYNAGNQVGGANRCTLIGSYAGYGVKTSTGDDNTLIGFEAGGSSLNSSANTMVGTYAGLRVSATSTNYRNTFIGYSAGSRLQFGNHNIAVGYYSFANSSGAGNTTYHNIAIGTEALKTLDGSDHNIAIGNKAGESLAYQSDYNIFIGVQAGISKGSYKEHSVIIGSYSDTDDEYNVAIGSYATSTADASIALGARAAVSHGGALVIGASTTTTISSMAVNSATLHYSSMYLGKDAAEDITIYAHTDDANLPYLKYDNTASKWVGSSDGTTEFDLESSGGDGYADTLYYGTDPVLYTGNAPSPYGSQNSVYCDGYFFFEKDTTAPNIIVEPTSTHDGKLLYILGQTDYTNTYVGGGIGIEAGDGYTAGDVYIKAGDTSVGNIILHADDNTDMGGGEGCTFIADSTVVPTSNPTGGGYLYVESGALKWKGSSGTVTIIASA